MTEPEPSRPEPRSGRGLKIALAVSLALNLGVVGIVGGSMIAGAMRDPRPEMVRDLGFGPFSEALSRADRDALRKSYLAEAKNFRVSKRERREEFAGFLAALRSDPFDRTTFLAVVEQQNQRGRDRLELGQRLLADRLVAMSTEERRAFADRLEARLSHGPGRETSPPGG